MSRLSRNSICLRVEWCMPRYFEESKVHPDSSWHSFLVYVSCESLFRRVPNPHLSVSPYINALLGVISHMINFVLDWFKPVSLARVLDLSILHSCMALAKPAPQVSCLISGLPNGRKALILFTRAQVFFHRISSKTMSDL